MKAHLLFSASGIGLVYLLVGSLPLAAMPLVPEKQTLGTEGLKELETEVSLNTSSVDNPVKIPGIDELKPADAVEVENTGDRPVVSTAKELAPLPQEDPQLNRRQTATFTAENTPENSLKLAEKPANSDPASVTEEISVTPSQNQQTPAEFTAETSVIPAQNPAAPAIAQTGISAPVPTETSTAQKLAEIENSSSLEPAATNSETEEPIELQQVTSVSQLSDVRPTDWAFQALQSLVERYGCIAGYPDGTFRGNRAMTRYEFAAGLNACLDKVSELIRAGTGNFATRDDLAALQRLQEEFAAELATLRGRVDALEARTSELEANQFSTTTKLTGEAIFALSDDFSGDVGVFGRDHTALGSDNNETVFQQRVRLNLNTSFTGRDLLLTRLQVGNGQRFNLGATSEGTQTWNFVGRTDNVVALDTLLYKFPVGQRLNVTLAANSVVWDDILPTVNPYFEDFDGGNGSLSTFGQRNPIYRLGGGSGIGFDYAFGGRGLLGGVFGPTSLSFGYLASNAASPARGAGLTNGDYTAMGQLTFTPGRNLPVAFNYHHGDVSRGNFGFDNGLSNGQGSLGGFTGTGVANSLNGLSEGFDGFRGRKVVSDSYGAQASLRLSPRFILGGWAGLTNARIIGIGDAKIWNYAVTLAFPDLGKEGNLLGFVLGREPYLDKLEAARSLRSFANDNSYHLEGFYKFQLSDNISVTPGVIYVTNPNQNDDNDDIFIGTLRTTFTF